MKITFPPNRGLIEGSDNGDWDNGGPYCTTVEKFTALMIHVTKLPSCNYEFLSPMLP